VEAFPVEPAADVIGRAARGEQGGEKVSSIALIRMPATCHHDGRHHPGPPPRTPHHPVAARVSCTVRLSCHCIRCGDA
jgi:hypothetical protein